MALAKHTASFFLSRMDIQNVGPFQHHTVDFDSTITCIIGPNDSGKSILLRLTQATLNAQALEGSKHHNALRARSTQPNTDENYRIRLDFAVRDCLPPLLVTDTISFSRNIAETPPRAPDTAPVQREGQSLKTQPSGIVLPRAHLFELSSPVPDDFDTNSDGVVEQALLRLAFDKHGRDMGALFVGGMEPEIRAELLREASERLTTNLNERMPPEYRYKYVLHGESRHGARGVSLSLRDSRGYNVPLSRRGKGLHRALTFLLHTWTIAQNERPAVVLLDEPELHLHPGLQHWLRGSMETFAASAPIQFVYATHSAAMVNTWRPRAVHCLQQPGTRPSTDAAAHGYAAVRRALGSRLEDSLNLANAIAVVEGTSDAVAVEIVATRLATEAQLQNALSNSGVLVGNGDGALQACRYVLTQGCRPVVLLDGDKQTTLAPKIAELGVTVVCLPLDTEIEAIVPERAYIESLSEIYGLHRTFDEFDQWRRANIPGVKYITHAAVKWLQSLNQRSSYSKVDVLRRALNRSASGDFSPDVLSRLTDFLSAIQKEANSAGKVGADIE